jgi:hypothetical protein
MDFLRYYDSTLHGGMEENHESSCQDSLLLGRLLNLERPN